MVFVVDTVRVEDAVPLGGMDKLEALKVRAGPGGVTTAPRVTVPEKLFRLVAAIVDEPEAPVAIVRVGGLAVSTKSVVPLCTASPTETQFPLALSMKVTLEPVSVELTISYSTAFVPGGVMIVYPGSAAGKAAVFK